MDMAKMYPGVVVTEGVLDAIRVGPMGVALFGKVPSPHQETLLATHWRNGVLLWIPDSEDPKSVDAANTYVEKWNASGVFQGGAHVVNLPSGDPGATKREDIWSLVLAQAPSLSRFAGEHTPLGSGTVG